MPIILSGDPLVYANPFTESVAGKYFVGREEQLKLYGTYLTGLRSGHANHFYIAGTHGTGKTSYLAKLVEIARANGFVGAMPTLDENRSAYDQVGTITRKVITELQIRLKESDLVSHNEILGDWEKGKDSRYFQSPRADRLESDRIRDDYIVIRRFMNEAKLPGCVICIDEGQRIDPAALSALKNSLQHVGSVLVVMSLRVVEHPRGPVEAGRDLLNEKAREAEGDFGASRFYVTGVPLGPFVTEQEASECIRKRLEHNAVQFGDDVVSRIGQISGRIPRTLISLAAEVYNSVTLTERETADVSVLHDTFRRVYRGEVAEARSLCEKLSEAARASLSALLELAHPSDGKAIAVKVFPRAAECEFSYISLGVVGELARVCEISRFCVRTDERFAVPDPVHAYALKLALGSA